MKRRDPNGAAYDMYEKEITAVFESYGYRDFVVNYDEIILAPAEVMDSAARKMLDEIRQYITRGVVKFDDRGDNWRLVYDSVKEEWVTEQGYVVYLSKEEVGRLRNVQSGLESVLVQIALSDKRFSEQD